MVLGVLRDGVEGLGGRAGAGACDLVGAPARAVECALPGLDGIVVAGPAFVATFDCAVGFTVVVARLTLGDRSSCLMSAIGSVVGAAAVLTAEAGVVVGVVGMAAVVSVGPTAVGATVVAWAVGAASSDVLIGVAVAASIAGLEDSALGIVLGGVAACRMVVFRNGLLGRLVCAAEGAPGFVWLACVACAALRAAAFAARSASALLAVCVMASNSEGRAAGAAGAARRRGAASASSALLFAADADFLRVASPLLASFVFVLLSAADSDCLVVFSTSLLARGIPYLLPRCVQHIKKHSNTLRRYNHMPYAARADARRGIGSPMHEAKQARATASCVITIQLYLGDRARGGEKVGNMV